MSFTQHDSLNSINWLVFMMETQCVFYELRNEFNMYLKKGKIIPVIDRGGP
jgi:hypothetical protein